MPSRAPSTSTHHGPSYREHPYWLNYQKFFPGGLRLGDDSAPEEQWWRWRGLTVHLDRVTRPAAPAKVIALHGAGTYGRMLAPFGWLPSLSGLEFLAPDLPGFGLTGSYQAVGFSGWRRCVLDLIAAERAADPRPIVLFGVGFGGLLAYDVAARAGADVRCVVTTGLADPRHAEVRNQLAAWPALGEWASALALVPGPVRSVPRVPLRWLTNVAAVANQAQFAHLVLSDPLGGARWVPLSFVRTFLGGARVVVPERFEGPPLLLAHPSEDRWTPLLLSERFFDRIPGHIRFATLSGAGHLPLEEPGLADLDRAVRDFFDELALQ